MIFLFSLLQMSLTLYFGLLVAGIAMTKAKKNFTVTEEVWFDIEIKDYDQGDDYRGRFVVGLFGGKCPVTTLNFKSLAKGYKRGSKTLSYKNTPIHRVVTDFVVQMGDVTNGDGTGGESIYGPRFGDENFDLSHRAPGMVAMANRGPDSNGSQFFVLLSKARWLDGKHVVFGKVIKGMDVIKTLGDLELKKETSMPVKNVKIIDCGIVGIDRKYELSNEQVDSDEDIN
ncbi:hypothetical protein KUTeg_017526 [Tegillarca granosa]|uniref:Peptidyl-prolyl cis-trans isomerase n=1 Tax=Tegillarca granosa TaxID=220873 RepID=A0ABQ9EL25_TEGGR|nr:hypothetical protein KUTeg_017526 [Tegillarca granosa]